MFEKLNRKIKTRHFATTAYDSSHIMSVLPYTDVEALQVLNLNSFSEHSKLDDILKTEQWKQVGKMSCEFYDENLTVEYLCHFPSCSVKFRSISARELDFWKKTMVGSSKLQYSFFDLCLFNEMEELSNFWGPAFILESLGACLWYFRMRNSTENILSISILRDSVSCNVIKFGDVLTGAIVQN